MQFLDLNELLEKTASGLFEADNKENKPADAKKPNKQDKENTENKVDRVAELDNKFKGLNFSGKREIKKLTKEIEKLNSKINKAELDSKAESLLIKLGLAKDYCNGQTIKNWIDKSDTNLDNFDTNSQIFKARFIALPKFLKKLNDGGTDNAKEFLEFYAKFIDDDGAASDPDWWDDSDKSEFFLDVYNIFHVPMGWDQDIDRDSLSHEFEGELTENLIRYIRNGTNQLCKKLLKQAEKEGLIGEDEDLFRALSGDKKIKFPASYEEALTDDGKNFVVNAVNKWREDNKKEEVELTDEDLAQLSDYIKRVLNNYNAKQKKPSNSEEKSNGSVS